MRVHVVAVGRLKAGPERDLVERYRARSVALGRNLGFEGPSVADLAEGRARRAQDRRTDEAGRLRPELAASLTVVLDETAPSPDSVGFASRLAGWRDAGEAAVSFVIGGPDGLDPAFRAGAGWSVGFGRLTLPHGLVRVLLVEQIYRAFTIISGHPYHRGGAGDG